MGFFFRRALRLGPVRFNLSKNGVGVSAGVKGLRVGIDAKGREYVAGGREGVYFREYATERGQGDYEIIAPSATEAQEAARPARRSVWAIIGWTVLLVVLLVAAVWIGMAVVGGTVR